MAQVVKLEFPFGVEFDEFFCPACGAALMDRDQFAGHPCPHLAFAYIDEAGEFAYVSPRLGAAAARADEDDDDPVATLAAKLPAGTSVVFELTTGGMGCGPVWSTVVFGIELSPGRRKAAPRRPRAASKKEAAAPSASRGAKPPRGK